MNRQEFKKLIASKEKPILIDVREADEWDAGHIEGAIHVPLSHLEADADWAIPHYGYPVVLYCAHGKRSGEAAEILVDLGYYSVSVLEGGYQAYMNQKYE